MMSFSVGGGWMNDFSHLFSLLEERAKIWFIIKNGRVMQEFKNFTLQNLHLREPLP